MERVWRAASLAPQNMNLIAGAVGLKVGGLSGAAAAYGLQVAWFDAWMRPILQASEADQPERVQLERRARLVQRGIPDQLARQGLRLVER